jgi:hypothetical protein
VMSFLMPDVVPDSLGFLGIGQPPYRWLSSAIARSSRS